MSGAKGRVTGVEVGGTVVVGGGEGLETRVAESDVGGVCGGTGVAVVLTSGICSKDTRDDDDDAEHRAVPGAAGIVFCCELEVRGQGAHFVECLGCEQRGHDVGLELDEKVFPQ